MNKLTEREEEDAFILITTQTAYAISQAITPEMRAENIKLPITVETMQIILDGLRICVNRLHNAGMIDYKKGSENAAEIIEQLRLGSSHGKTKH